MSPTKTVDEPSATAKRARDLNHQVIGLGRKTGASFLSAYESTAATVADYQEKLAKSTRDDWVAVVGHAQASFTRDVAKLRRTPPRLAS
jgi:hypothetical protein